MLNQITKNYYQYMRDWLVAKAFCNKSNTFASFDPQVTLDYVFISKEFKPVEFEVKDVIASDHLPVFARLELNV